MQNTADILSVINDHGFDDTSTQTKLAFLNDAIADFCSREPWPFLEAAPVTLTFDGVSSMPTNFPSDFLSAISIVDPNTTRPITPERVDTIEKSDANLITQTGDPFFYYFIGHKLNFAPIPLASQTLRLRYLAMHPDVTVDTTSVDYLVPQRHWMLLVYGTLQRLYDLDDDPEMSARFEQHFESRIMRMRDELWKTQYDRPDRVVITDPDFLLDLPI